MSKKAKRILTGVLLGAVVVGLFATDIAICYEIGANIKEKRIEQQKAEAKQRYINTLIESGEKMITPAVERDIAEKVAKQAELKKDLEEDYQEHKNDGPVPASKPMTEEEKANINKG